MEATAAQVKVTREGRVYVGPRSIGTVYQRQSYLVASGCPKWEAKNRGGEITRHETRKAAVAHLTAGWL